MNDLGTLSVGFELDTARLGPEIDAAVEQVVAGNEMILASYDDLASGVTGSLDDLTTTLDSTGSSMIEILLQIADNVKDVQYAVEDMSSNVGGAIEDLDPQFAGLAESATTAGEAVSAAGETASGGLTDLLSTVGMAAFGIQALTGIASQLANSLLSPAENAETVSTALITLDGSAAAAAQEMQQLNSFAAQTPFKTLDIDTAAEQLQGFGISASNVIPEITSIGDALGSVGRDTPAELDSVVQIFGKMHTEGKVTEQTMNELAVHGINGWQALSDATGQTIPQLKEMVAQGLLPADQAIDDLTKGIEMNPLYAGGMGKAAGTLSGLLSTLQSDWDQVIASFGTPIIKAVEGDLGKLGNTLASPAFQQFAGAVGQGIVTTFEDIGGAVSTVGKYFGSFDLTALTASFGNLGAALAPLATDLQQLGSNKEVTGFLATLKNDLSQGIVKAIEDTSSFINGLATDLQQLGSNKEVTGFLADLSSGFKQVQQIVGGQLGQDFQLFGQTVQQLGQWFQADMVPAIKDAEPGFEHLGQALTTTVAPAFAQIWAVGQNVAREFLPKLVEGFEAVEPVVVRVGGFLADKVGGALQFVTPFVVEAARELGKFAEQIESRVEPIITGLWTDIKIGLDWIKPYWPAIWDGMKEEVTIIWDMISGGIKVAWSIVSGIIVVGLDLLQGNWKQAWTDMKDHLAGVKDGIVTMLSGLGSAIWGPIRDGLNTAIDGVNAFIRNIDGMHFSIAGHDVGVDIPTIPRLWTGGEVGPGQMFIAGDSPGGANGELVVAGSAGATVLNHSQTMAALAGSGGSGGGNAPQIIHVHIYLPSGEEIASYAVEPTTERVVAQLQGYGPVTGRVA